MPVDDESKATRLRLLTSAAGQLDQAGVEHPRRNAEWLLADVLGCDRAHLYAYARAQVAPSAARRFERAVARRAAREPLQYIIGHTDFCGLRLTVTPAVLIPRPETEELVERVLQRLEGMEAPRVLDVGTGSGCIALAIKHHCPGAVVHACDVSADALHLAQQNAATLELDVAFFEADLLSEGFVDAVASPYDAVVSNPPYVPDAEYNALAPEVRDHEPSTALRTGAAPLRYYRALAQRHAAIAAPGGLLAVEAHTDHASAVATCFAEHGLAGATVHRDLSGLARMVEARVPIR